MEAEASRRRAEEEARQRAQELAKARLHAAQQQQQQRAAMVEKLRQRRSRQARRFERARRQALKEAEVEERAAAVKMAQSERFRFPELCRFSAACGLSGFTIPGDVNAYTWLELFCAIADEVPHSIMLVDMRVEGLPLTFCNKAATQLTGYTREEMVGRNCRFMQGRRTQGSAVRAFSRAVREAKEALVVVTNFRKDGTSFTNLVALRPVFSDEEGYVYNIAVQCELPNGESRPTWHAPLLEAIPRNVSSEAAARAGALARAADAHQMGQLAQHKLMLAHRRETLIMLTRLVFSLDCTHTTLPRRWSPPGCLRL